MNGMTYEQMREVIRLIKPGDEFEVVFANKTFDGDLKGRLYMVLAMWKRSISLDDLSILTLQAVADSGGWEGFRTYIITALDDFDPEYFASRTIGREMLESIRIID
jgi:hypothetical protein